MISIIKKHIKNIISVIRYLLYNKKFQTRIQSKKANLNAKYAIGVSIGENTIVTDDVVIGMYSYVNRDSSLENCVIGNYCSISSGVHINPFEHNLSLRSTHPFANPEPSLRDKVFIGNDCLISINVIILKGVKIGNGAVIGAGAVVTKNVAPFEIVGGVPARHIGWRFDEEECEKIEKMQWWNYDSKTLRDNIDYFTLKSDVFVMPLRELETNDNSEEATK